MAKSLFIATGTEVAIPAASSRYCACAITNISSRADETLSQIVYRSAGTFSRLWVRITANATTAPSTVRLRVNGSNVNQVITIPAGQTGTFEDTANSDVVTSGQKVCYEMTAGAGGTLTVRIISVLFEPSAAGTTVSRLACDISGGAAFATASVNRFNQLVSEISSGVGVESSAQTFLSTAGTLKNLEVLVRDNARTTATTVRSRKNTGNGNQVITIDAGTTGVFEDTVNSDTIAAGDNADTLVATLTGTQTLTIEHIAIDFVTTNGVGFSSYGRVGAFAQAEPSTRFPMIGGNAIVAVVTGEPNSQVKTRMSGIYSKLSVYVTANTINATVNLTLRKNGANANQSIAIPSTGTGLFTDSANTDYFNSGDLINLQNVTPDVTGSQTITIRHFSIQYTPLTDVEQDNIRRYSLSQNVEEDNIRRYSLRQNVDKLNIRRYSLFSLLAIPNIRRYSLRQVVNPQSIRKYSIWSLVNALTVRRYNLLQYLNAQNIRRYSLRQFLNIENIRRYNIRQSLAAQTTRLYQMFQNVTAQNIRRYSLLQYVTQLNIRRYGIRELVQATSIRLYDVAAAIGVIAVQSIRRYTIYEYVSVPHIRRYNILQQISTESIRLYNIAAPSIMMTVENIRRYDIKALITVQTIRRYNILEFGKKLYSMLGAGRKVELDQAAKILQDFIRGGYPSESS
jgi:hypothetical protein